MEQVIVDGIPDGRLFDDSFRGIFEQPWPGVGTVRGFIDWKVTVPSEGACLPLTQPWVYVGMGVDAPEDKAVDFDIGTVAYSCQEDKSSGKQKCKSVDYLFYGHKNPERLRGAMEFSGDNVDGEGEGDDEWLFYNLANMPPEVTHIAISVNIYSGASGFNEMEGAMLRVALAPPGAKWTDFNTVAYIDMDEMKDSKGQYFTNRAIIFGALFRDIDSNWLWGAQGVNAPEELRQVPSMAHFGGGSQHWKFASIKKNIGGQSLRDSEPTIKRVMEGFKSLSGSAQLQHLNSFDRDDLLLSKSVGSLVERDRDAMKDAFGDPDDSDDLDLLDDLFDSLDGPDPFAASGGQKENTAESFWTEHPAGPTGAGSQCFVIS